MRYFPALLLLTLAWSVGSILPPFWGTARDAASQTMKHFALLMVMTMAGAVGAMINPFWGLLLYYVLAILRPQHLWDWSLPMQWRWSLLAAGATLLGVLMNVPRVMQRARMNPVTWLMIGFGVLLLISCLTAHDPHTAQKWGEEYAKIFIIALIAALVINRFWQVHVAAVMVLVVLGYVAYEINSLYIFQRRLDIFHYGFGGLDNNGAGLMLAMGLPFAYAFGVSAPKRWQQIVAWVLGALMLHAVLMTYSRGAMLSALVGAMWLMWRHRSAMQSVLIALALSGAVLLLAGPEIRDRFLSTGEYQSDGSAQKRMDSWGAAWRVAMEHPFTGVGIRNSNHYSYNYGADRHGRTIHSQYLQIAADSGIPAMALYVTMLGAALWSVERARRTCLQKLRPRGEHPLPAVRSAELSVAADIALAVQASLIIFAFGALFLSLEVFELPWLMLVIAGCYPRIANQVAGDLAPEAEAAPARKRKRIWSRGRLWPAAPQKGLVSS